MKQKREQERQQRNFDAGLQGIDLEKHEQTAVKERLQKIREEADAILAGGEERLEARKLTGIGFKVKTV